MAEQAERHGKRSRGGWAIALLPVVLGVGGCGHDWSAGGPDDAAISDADAHEGGEGAEDAGGRDEATADDVDVADDAVPPGCGNGLLETGEECDPPLSDGNCSSGTCAGVRTCDNACRWEPCDFGWPPAGDDCDGPEMPEIVVGPTGSGTFAGSTCGATDDGVVSVCGGSGVPDLMYRLELTQPSAVTLDTNGSAFDAVLRLLQGPACPGSDATCDAGDPVDPAAQARLQVYLPAGSYWVVVDGAGDGAQGDYVLNATIASIPAVANDSCTGAISLSPGSTPRTVSGTTAGATSDVLPDTSTCALGRDGPDVWYRLSLTERSLVYLDLLDGQTWDSVLDVRSGVCSAPASVACEDDACGTERSRFVGWLDGGDYLVVVDGRTLVDSGAFTLRYLSLRQSRPCMVDAELLSADGGYLGRTDGGSSGFDPSCSSGAMLPEQVYGVPLCAGRLLSATTCDPATEFDTVLALTDGRCFTDLVCNDESPAPCISGVDSSASLLEYTATVPGLYLLVVDGSAHGLWPDRGQYMLHVTGL
jgi:hypothetical protein